MGPHTGESGAYGIMCRFFVYENPALDARFGKAFSGEDKIRLLLI